MEKENKTVVQILRNLGESRGGLTRASLDRFRLLAKGRRAILLTVSHQPDLLEVFNKLIEIGDLPKHTELFNYHFDLGADPARSPHASPRLAEVLNELDGVSTGVKTSKNGQSVWTRYFVDGLLLGTITTDAKNRLVQAEKMLPGSPWVRDFVEVFDKNEHLVKREYYDQNNSLKYRVYYSPGGYPYLSTWVDEGGYESQVVEHSRDGSTTLSGGIRRAHAQWVEERLTGFGPATVYSDEPYATFALEARGPNIRHVASIHGAHRKPNGSLKPWAAHYLRNIENIGTLVFFTEAQRADFVADTNFDRAKTVVIPHAAPKVDHNKFPMRDSSNRHRLIAISRLVENKRLDHAIRAFEAVARILPDARFDIFGKGPERQGLASLIVELGLGEQISLHDYTRTPLAEFASSTASIVTSTHEGFGLVVTESFSVGTPVVSYDVPYGPRELIKDGFNGYKALDGDINALTFAILKVLLESDRPADLRSGAVKTANSFTEEKWATKWNATL